MRLLVIAFLGLVVIAASTSVSRADDGCGRGWYWNGYNCAPMRYAPRPRYDDRDYDRRRWRRDRWRHHRHDHDYDHGPRFESHGPRYDRPDRHRWHTWNGCPRHYTVQDGLCKRYRGGRGIESHGYYPPDRRRWHTPNGCQPAWTVQNGLCRPYVGAGYYPPDHHKWHTSNGCQPHYTVQDGLCKPYRGY